MKKLHLSHVLMLVALGCFVSRGFAEEGAAVESSAPEEIADASEKASADVSAETPAVESKSSEAAPVVAPVEPKDTDEALSFLAKDLVDFKAKVTEVKDEDVKAAFDEAEDAFDSVSDVLNFFEARIESLEKGTGVKSALDKIRKEMKAKKEKRGKGMKRPGKGKRKGKKPAKGSKKPARKIVKSKAKRK